MRRILTILSLSIFVFAILSFKAYAQKEEFALITEDAVILDLKGDVDVKLTPSARWANAKVGMVLSKSSELRTGRNSWVEVGFELGYGNENVIRLQGDSTLKFTQTGPARLNLLKGELRTLVQGLSGGSTFEVRTPTAVCGARGTGWDTNTDGKKTTVDTYENKVSFSPLGKAKKKTIKEGKRGVLEDPDKPVKIGDLPPGKMDNWKKWKEDMSKRTGIKVGVKGKMGKGRIVEKVMKGKERSLERKDLDSIKDRLDDRSDRKGGYNRYREVSGE
jgi:hypothetical protein